MNWFNERMTCQILACAVGVLAGCGEIRGVEEMPTSGGTDGGSSGSDDEGEVDESSDGSSSSGPITHCGDGVVEEGEACDDGEDNGSAATCTPECQVNVCGDGFVLEGVEACDDSNLEDADGCEADCSLPACDNGIIDPGELCLDVEPRIHEIPPMARDVRFGDVDGDGNVDAVAMFLDAVNDFYDVQVYLGDGTGGFTDGPSFAGEEGQREITLEDVDGDEVLDLVIGGGDSVCPFEPCVPVPGTLRVHLGKGDGSFEAPIDLQATPAPGRAYVADVNGDGARDLVVPERGPMSDPGFSVYLRSAEPSLFGAPAFYDTSYYVPRLAVVDADGDDVLDVLAVGGTEVEGIELTGAGDGSFSATGTFPAGEGPSDIGVLATEGDYAPLLVLPRSMGMQAAIVGRSGGDWQHVDDVQIGGDAGSVTVADLTHDGIADFVVPNRQPNFATVRVGLGDGTFDNPTPYQPGAFPIATGVADLNQDGAMDLVVATRHGGRLSVFLARP